MRYRRHIFICTNRRSGTDPRGSCAQKGSEEIQAIFKKELKARGLSNIVRANKSGCLDACEFGPNIVIYPEGVWYRGVSKEDVVEIIERHIIGGEVVARLSHTDGRYLPDNLKYPSLHNGIEKPEGGSSS